MIEITQLFEQFMVMDEPEMHEKLIFLKTTPELG